MRMSNKAANSRAGRLLVWQPDNGKTFPRRQVKGMFSEAASSHLVAAPNLRQRPLFLFMRRLLRTSCIFVAFCLQPMHGAENVDVIFQNGNVYTVNYRQARAEAIAVKNERIVFVGSDNDAKNYQAARTVDLKGKTVLPGLTDSHCHIFGIGEREMHLNLEGTNSLEA